MGPALTRNGFPHVTRLWFLRHRLQLSAADLARRHELRFDAYNETDARVFKTTLLQTYRDTLDCPELNGVRDIHDILAGHRAQGRFNPAMWWLARTESQEPAGVLLVNSMEDETWEIVYMGVAPEHRRRGIGRQLVLKGLVEAKLAGRREVTLSVDERNSFACRLYESVGFETFDCRDVYLSMLTPSCRSPSAGELTGS